MEKEAIILREDNIKDKIYSIRGLQVMLDSDLAELYGVETKVLNQAVNRNIERFPSSFMFQLSEDEYNSMRSQFVTSKNEALRFQFGASNKGRGGRTYLPYAFTEQGVAMLSTVLRSKTAVRISIQIINAFVTMRKFIASNASVFFRLDNVERKQLSFEIKTDKNFEKVFSAIEDKTLSKKQGIFFGGQIFEAYSFVSDLIRSAEKSIILIDNYIDDTVLTLFNKRSYKVGVTIFTKEISKELELDLKKYNSQYPPIEIKEFIQSHDKFLIIDNKEVYHAEKTEGFFGIPKIVKKINFCDFGASLKDLGKKWFGFSKMNKKVFNLMEKLGLK